MTPPRTSAWTLLWLVTATLAAQASRAELFPQHRGKAGQAHDVVYAGLTGMAESSTSLMVSDAVFYQCPLQPTQNNIHTKFFMLWLPKNYHLGM
ncbi:hypothetical protein QBC36DRAFT_318565, partial [Triangularia setosa]